MSIPTKEELYKWYVEEDGNYKDAPAHFDITRWCFESLCREYGIKKDRKKSTEKGVRTKQSIGKEEYKQKMLANREKTIVEKYGSLEAFYKYKGSRNRAAWDNNHEELLSKIHRTHQKNNSFNSSDPEDKYFLYLKEKYGEKNIIPQYRDERYPFACDFYIPSEDLFIELNLHWTHGGHPFNSNNQEDQLLLLHWRNKAKISDFYKNAIKTWTERDVEKLQTAKKNNLNYRVYYTEDELYKE